MRSDLKIRTSVRSTACSPSAEGSAHVLDQENHCSTDESICFKENINTNKSETPKLCMEPLQMKRKKKGGGYNLRKSLAWDKAFFTEEGVLDPIELSVISGTTCRERLSFINNDTPGSQLPIKFEKDVLKEMQDEYRGRVGSKDWSSPKIDSASSNNMKLTTPASRKLKTHLGKISESRCGDCPQPFPASSLKRPAIVNVGKAAAKDLKLPKFPGMKTGPSPIGVSNMSTILKMNSMKHNQIGKPDFDIQKNPGSNSLSRSFLNTQNASNSSLQRPPRSDENSGKRLSSAGMSPGLAGNSGSRMVSGITTSARSVNSSEDRKGSTFSAPLFSRNAGTAIHPLPNPPMKPSGLRMPSPSLSVFSQPMPLENARLQDNMTRKPKIDSGIPERTISGNGRSSSLECMASSHVNVIEVSKPKMERKSVKKIPHNCKYRTGRITNEEKELQKVDTELPSGSESREQVMDGELSSEHLCVSQQSSSYSGSTSIGTLERTQVEVENSYFGSKHLHENHAKETSPKSPTNVLVGKIHMENGQCASSIGGFRSYINLTSEVDNDTNPSKEDMAPPRNTVSNTSNKLLPEEQLCARNSLQGKKVKKLISVVSDRLDGDKAMKTMAESSLSPVNNYDPAFDEVKKSGHLYVSTKLDNSSLSEIHSGLEDVISNNADVFSDNPGNRKFSNSLHQDNHTPEIDYCSSFHESRSGECSQENAFGKVTEMGAILQYSSTDNPFTSNVASRDRESGMDNLRLRRSQNSGSVLVLLPEINMLKESCVKESLRLTSPSDEFVAENFEHHNRILYCENYLPVKCPVDVTCVDNTIGRKEGSETGEYELCCLSTSTSTRLSGKEIPLLRDENCNHTYGVKGHTADAIHDLSKVESYFDPTRSKVSEDTNDSLSCLHLNSDHVKVQPAFSPNNIDGDDLHEKNFVPVLPQNAIPFSEEWLAALEAAGEDILSKKGGAVQNSPPDKSLPEPGPWSPVKRKTNQIGPFDCTKFTNIIPSNSE